MEKEEIIQAIAAKRVEQEQIGRNITVLKKQLAAFAEWRVGDIVQTRKGVFKLSRLAVNEKTGEASSYDIYGFKQKKDGDWFENDHYIGIGEKTLIERPKAG